MDLKKFFQTSSNEIYEQNMDLLEEYDLINTFGSPNKLFLKFLKSKNLEINSDKITPELIEEFEGSIDSLNLKAEKINREKQTIFNQRKVWIAIDNTETYLLLEPDGITIESTRNKIPYSQMENIEISEGSWSKNMFKIRTKNKDITFEINEDKAIPLKEILEDNIDYRNHDEIDDLLELYSLYEEGKISEEELEIKKAIIYSDDAYCTNCGEKLEPDSEFCTNCGQEVEL